MPHRGSRTTTDDAPRRLGKRKTAKACSSKRPGGPGGAQSCHQPRARRDPARQSSQAFSPRLTGHPCLTHPQTQRTTHTRGRPCICRTWVSREAPNTRTRDPTPPPPSKLGRLVEYVGRGMRMGLSAPRKRINLTDPDDNLPSPFWKHPLSPR